MAMLAVLTLGPAYGHQLHAEVVERTGRERALNVGQVYATLDRLRRDGLIQNAGTTDDGLPLYELSASGIAAATDWLTVPVAAEWDEMVEQVLVARSMPDFDSTPLITGQRRAWIARAATAAGPTRSAAQILSEAALRWLDELPPSKGWQLRTDRPKRGRRKTRRAAEVTAS